MNIKKEFPIFKNHPNLVYLDNAATTQKPQCVLDAVTTFYTTTNSNIHRGIHSLSQQASEQYLEARKTIASFVNAKDEKSVIFTQGTTASINGIAQALSRTYLQTGKTILISEMEHHSNIVPWQEAASATGATLEFVPIKKTGKLDMEAYEELLAKNDVTVVSITHVSNTTGMINPVKEMATLAHQHNALIIIDGAQAIPHFDVDVQDIDCDMYVFSAHKMYGPTGIGAWYGKNELLNNLPPYQTGGGMIKEVTKELTTFQETPERFEAGTPPIAQAIGFAQAAKWLKENKKEIQKQEQDLILYAQEQLSTIKDLTILGTSNEKAGAISFTIPSIHPHDIGHLLDEENIAVRTGYHCTEPLMKAFDVYGTVRISFGAYNTREDIDRCVIAIKKAISIFL